jgi:hypothetical protein
VGTLCAPGPVGTLCAPGDLAFSGTLCAPGRYILCNPGNISLLGDAAAVGDLVLIFGRAGTGSDFLGFLKSFELVPCFGYLLVGIDGAALIV